ncbi:AsmA family protein [Caldimonas brevitalea]|uniref:AsmA protein n=1 Tax=Caldimonas brevitalea TaxID=413882 RepID=A0A0G3BT55_9BURK|nr:AsmA family protein [Caldimonas brevitalea]AKJ31193.1 AsmA protein [Caldimonas brevitalea]
MNTSKSSPWVKRIALGVAALLALLAAAATYLIVSFDANRYKGVLVDWMREHRQRTLTIGDVGLSVFPRLGVTLRDVTLSEHQRADEFVHLEEAKLAVDLLPLLRRRLVVDRVTAQGVRLAYRVDAQGRRNIDDLLAPDDPKATPDDNEASRQLSFDVQGAELRAVRLRVDDVPGQVRGEVVVQTLDLGRLADGAEAPLTLDAQLALQQPAVEGRLQGQTRLTLDRTRSAVHLRETELRYQGHALGLRELDSRLSGALSYDGAQGALGAEGLKLATSAMLGAVKLESSTLSVQRFGYQPQRQALSLEQLGLQFKAVRDKQPIELSLSWPRLQVEGQALQGSALQGQLALGGPQPWKAEFRSAAPSGNFDQVRLPAFEATLHSSGTRRLGGTVRADLALQPAKAALALDALKVQAQVQDPQLKPLAVRLDGRLSASTRAASWELKGGLNDNTFNTRGQATFTGTVPHLDVSGEFATLDVNSLLADAPTTPAQDRPATPTSGPATAADTPVDLAPLRQLQGKLSLKAARLIYRPYQLDDARINATLEGGMLRVSQLAGRIWGGSIDASAFADARAQRVMFKGTGNDIDVHAALQDIAKKDVLEGRGRVQVDLESAGRSVQELKSRLAGQAALQLRDGAIKGVNLARSLREAKAALSMRQDKIQQARQSEKTDFSELSATFQIANGVARNQDLDAKSPFLRLNGEGTVDVGKSRIDYLARASVANTSKGQGGDELTALRGVTVPVQLSGPLDAVDWRIQWSAVAAAAAQAAVKHQLEDKLLKELGGKRAAQGTEAAASAPAQNARDAARDKLKDKLKGLLK